MTLPRYSAKLTACMDLRRNRPLIMRKALYEKRLLTYPRTDSKYITSDMQDAQRNSLPGFVRCFPYAGREAASRPYKGLRQQQSNRPPRYLPPAEFLKAGFASLADSETKLMTLVCAKLLCAAAAPYAYEAVTAVFTCGGYTFTAKGRTTLCEGWREIERLSRAASEEQDEDAERKRFCPAYEGQTFEIPQRRSPSVTRSPQKHIPKIRFCPLWRTRARGNAGGRGTQGIRHHRDAGGYH